MAGSEPEGIGKSSGEPEGGCFGLELGEKIVEVVCECCGQPKKRVWGFVSKHNEAFAVYYALLNTTEPEARVGLTLSIGPWWDDNAAHQRTWIHIEVRPTETSYDMTVRQASESNFYPWPSGGRPMDREEALASPLLPDFWEIADYVVEADPAIHSYLNGMSVDAAGRGESKAGN